MNDADRFKLSHAPYHALSLHRGERGHLPLPRWHHCSHWVEQRPYLASLRLYGHASRRRIILAGPADLDCALLVCQQAAEDIALPTAQAAGRVGCGSVHHTILPMYGEKWG